MDNSEKAILKTILYSDIFAYPLTQSEIWLFLMSREKMAKEIVKTKLGQLSSIQKVGDYYVVKGRKEIVTLRKSRLQTSKRKLQKAQRIASLLFFIPTIFFIGVSGGVAMQNADETDDIDLFVIVKKNTVWISRLLLLVLLQLSGDRRKRGKKYVRDKICLNMILDEEVLPFSKNRQDIYTAHEIIQVTPLIDRYDTYQKFLNQNIWVKKYMAHAYTKKKPYVKTKPHFLEQVAGICLSMSWIESIARIVQEWIMKRHKTSETITKNMLAFHPFDYRITTLLRFQEKVKAYE